MRPAVDTDGGPIGGQGVRSTWSWFVFLGVCFLGLSLFVFANLDALASDSIYRAGIIMIVVAVLHGAQAFRVRNWNGFSTWLCSSVVYGLAGVCVVVGSKLPLQSVYIFIGIALFLSAVARIWSSLQFHSESGGGWMFASGSATVVARGARNRHRYSDPGRGGDIARSKFTSRSYRILASFSSELVM